MNPPLLNGRFNQMLISKKSEKPTGIEMNLHFAAGTDLINAALRKAKWGEDRQEKPRKERNSLHSRKYRPVCKIIPRLLSSKNSSRREKPARGAGDGIVAPGGAKRNPGFTKPRNHQSPRSGRKNSLIRCRFAYGK